MANGKRHDHPLTDLLVYNLPVYRDDIDELIRKIIKIIPENKVDSIFDWFSPPPLDEFKRQLETKYSQLYDEARRNGWEVEGYIDPRTLRAQEIKSSIRSVLLRHWDPIGINETPEAHDEYDSYIPHLYQLLSTGSNDDIIMDYLHKVQCTNMELNSVLENLRGVAQELRKLNIKL